MGISYLVVNGYADNGALALTGNCLASFRVARYERQAADEIRMSTFHAMYQLSSANVKIGLQNKPNKFLYLKVETCINIDASSKHESDGHKLATRTDSQLWDYGSKSNAFYRKEARGVPRL